MNYVEFNGTSSYIDCGSDTALDDLPTGGFTIDGWFNLDGNGQAGFGTLWRKGDCLLNCSEGAPHVYIPHGTTTIDYTAAAWPYGFNTWYYVAVTYDAAGDRKAYIWINGALHGTSGASAGTYSSDAASNFTIGNNPAHSRAFDGSMGWIRVSNVVRYTTSGFAVPARDNPPLVDANTVALWKMNEGTGTAIDNAEGTEARDGTLSNVTWGSDVVEERNRIWRPWSR